MDIKLRSLVATSLGHFLNDGSFIIYTILIIYYREAGLTNVPILAILASLYIIISGLIQPPIGMLADRTEKDSLMLSLGLALIGFALIVFGLVFLFPSYFLIALATVILGFGLSFYHPIGGSILQWTFGPRDAPGIMGVNGSFGSAGRASFPIVIVFIIDLFGGALTLFYLGIGLLIAALLIFALLKDFEKNPSGSDHPKVPIGKFRRFLTILTSIVFVRSMFMMAIQVSIPLYLYYLYHSPYIMAWALTISYATAIFGQPFFGFLTGKYGGRFVVSLTTIMSTVFFIIFIYSNNMIISLSSMSFFFLFAWSGFPVLLGYVSQIVDKSILTSANGIVWGIGNTVGGATGTIIGGVILMVLGVSTSAIVDMFWIMTVFAIISIIMLPLLKERKNENRGLYNNIC